MGGLDPPPEYRLVRIDLPHSWGSGSAQHTRAPRSARIQIRFPLEEGQCLLALLICLVHQLEALADQGGALVERPPNGGAVRREVAPVDCTPVCQRAVALAFCRGERFVYRTKGLDPHMHLNNRSSSTPCHSYPRGVTPGFTGYGDSLTAVRSSGAFHLHERVESAL